MSLALYRKYRPGKWDEVIGQEHIVEPLAQSIKQETIAHAYLFSGPRGTGKTSIARIFAKAIGCTDKDLYEIDAASNTGVDDIRLLQDGVSTLPFESPYKVYIVDEVHMLSKSAFNALLKTLEEPPKHVIFILATTDTHKVPETVVSRCQVFNFKAPSVTELVKVITRVAKKENVTIDKDAVNLIALLGDGSFRDTLGVVQKVFGAAAGKEVTKEIVESVTDVPPLELAHTITKAIVMGDLPGSLAITSQAAANDLDLVFLHKLLLRTLRLALLLNVAPELINTIKNEVSSEEFKFLTGLPKENVLKIVPQALRELLPIGSQINSSFLPQLPLELALVKLLTISA